MTKFTLKQLNDNKRKMDERTKKKCFADYKILRIKVEALQKLIATVSDMQAEADSYYLQDDNDYNRAFVDGILRVRMAITRQIENLQRQMDRNGE